MKKFLVLLVMAFALCLSGCDSMCTDPVESTRILKQQGYSQVQTTGYSWLACGKNDWYSTGFTAKSPAGVYVGGTVCSGIFKGHTIRLD